jgi:uroporphyrinogen-III synthase
MATFTHVIITKPVETATSLITHFKNHNWHCLSYPTLEIIPYAKTTAFLQQQQQYPFDSAIFISPIAVHYAVSVYQLTPAALSNTTLIAQGPGTANALKQHGFRCNFIPEKEYSSEGLLALPLFGNITHHRIAIFKGKNGRDFLMPQLQKNGAKVTAFDCYERQCPTPKINLSDYIDDPQHALFIVSSGSALHNLAALLHFAHSTLNPNWHNCHLLVISDKMATLAKELGHRGPVYSADNASDDAIMACVNNLKTGIEI